MYVTFSRVYRGQKRPLRRDHGQKGGTVVARLRRMLSDQQVVDAFRTDERAFTRVRKLPFARVVALLVSGWKMSLPNRLNQLFRRLGQLNMRPTAAAFCRARRKVRPELFGRMNQEMVACLFEDCA